jgi:REP element-mobilizing transposase RayT
VVMPNHVHGIVWIREGATSLSSSSVGASRPFRLDEISHLNRAAGRDGDLVSVDGSPLRVGHAITSRRVERGSLGSMIASFKTQSTLAINRLRNTPGTPVWQRNYYEHVIRNEDDLPRVREYIRNNPAKWGEDPDNPANLL